MHNLAGEIFTEKPNQQNAQILSSVTASDEAF